MAAVTVEGFPVLEFQTSGSAVELFMIGSPFCLSRAHEDEQILFFVA